MLKKIVFLQVFFFYVIEEVYGLCVCKEVQVVLNVYYLFWLNEVNYIRYKKGNLKKNIYLNYEFGIFMQIRKIKYFFFYN